MRKAVTVTVFALLFSVYVTDSARALTVYWTDTLNPSADNIQRFNVGSEAVEIIVDDLGDPQSVAVDTKNGHVYWTDSPNGNIQRANLDGSNVEELISGERPTGITLDVPNGKMYWANGSTKRVHRSNLDGSESTAFTIPGDYLGGVAIDLLNDMLYWTDSGPGIAGIIYRRGLNSPNPGQEVVVRTRSGPDWVDVNPRTGDVYWSAKGRGRIYLNDEPFPLVEDTDSIEGIALDVIGGWIYWASRSGDRISRARLDGSDVEDVVTGLDDPYGIALDVPKLTVGDMNGDGYMNGLDVDLFVDAVLNDPFNTTADINRDGAVTGLDVDPFVEALLNGNSVANSTVAAIPEPSALILALGALIGAIGICGINTR